MSLYYLASYLFFTMHSTVCTVIDLFMCVCHIVLINYYYYYYLAVLHNNDINDT